MNNSNYDKLDRLATQMLNNVAEVGKIPPQSLELETDVLGAIMIESGALDNVIDILKPEMFYDVKHQKIYQSYIDLYQSSSRWTPLTW